MNAHTFLIESHSTAVFEPTHAHRRSGDYPVGGPWTVGLYPPEMVMRLRDSLLLGYEIAPP
jgi:hypothetical protein